MSKGSRGDAAFPHVYYTEAHLAKLFRRMHTTLIKLEVDLEA
jgi:hypothetical protein